MTSSPERYPGGVDLNWVKSNSVETVEKWLGRPAVRGVDYPTEEQIEEAKREREDHKKLDGSRHEK